MYNVEKMGLAGQNRIGKTMDLLTTYPQGQVLLDLSTQLELSRAHTPRARCILRVSCIDLQELLALVCEF